MTTKQPDWKLLASIGDAYPVQYGGYFVYIDKSGVYDPEGELWITDDEDENAAAVVYRFCLEPCTHINGVLSDNKYHPEHPAWFANSLSEVADFSGSTTDEMIEQLTGDDVVSRALAWRAIGEYHGLENLDGYPLTLTPNELDARYVKIRHEEIESGIVRM